MKTINVFLCGAIGYALARRFMVQNSKDPLIQELLEACNHDFTTIVKTKEFEWREWDYTVWDERKDYFNIIDEIWWVHPFTQIKVKLDCDNRWTGEGGRCVAIYTVNP